MFAGPDQRADCRKRCTPRQPRWAGRGRQRVGLWLAWRPLTGACTRGPLAGLLATQQSSPWPSALRCCTRQVRRARAVADAGIVQSSSVQTALLHKVLPGNMSAVVGLSAVRAGGWQRCPSSLVYITELRASAQKMQASWRRQQPRRGRQDLQQTSLPPRPTLGSHSVQSSLAAQGLCSRSPCLLAWALCPAPSLILSGR